MAASQDRGDPTSIPTLLLASSSPRRLDLLRQVGIRPERVLAAEIDETPGRRELPRDVAKRLSREKARACAAEGAGSFVLAADTVVGVGRRVLPKAETETEARACLELLSGRAHRVHTAVTMLTPGGAERSRTTETRLRFKRLDPSEISAYLESGEWRGKAGGYAIQGLAGAFVVRLVGSYTNVVGLPLAETVAQISGAGYDVHARWRDGGLVEAVGTDAAERDAVTA